MLKTFCDICKNEIEDEYYWIRISYEKIKHPHSNYATAYTYPIQTTNPIAGKTICHICFKKAENLFAYKINLNEF